MKKIEININNFYIGEALPSPEESDATPCKRYASSKDGVKPPRFMTCKDCWFYIPKTRSCFLGKCIADPKCNRCKYFAADVLMADEVSQKPEG